MRTDSEQGISKRVGDVSESELERVGANKDLEWMPFEWALLKFPVHRWDSKGNHLIGIKPKSLAQHWALSKKENAKCSLGIKWDIILEKIAGAPKDVQSTPSWNSYRAMRSFGCIGNTFDFFLFLSPWVLSCCNVTTVPPPIVSILGDNGAYASMFLVDFPEGQCHACTRKGGVERRRLGRPLGNKKRPMVLLPPPETTMNTLVIPGH